jgi:hypothetical protein
VSDHPYYNQEVHGPYELFDLGLFPLEEGGTLRGCQLAYATVGELSAARDNAILLLPWYAGTSKRLGQAYVGPGRALDPGRYFIILVNQFGSGLSPSPHNTPAPFGRARFPRAGTGDDVRAQERLVRERFGLEQLELVAGALMGAQQPMSGRCGFPTWSSAPQRSSGPPRPRRMTCCMSRPSARRSGPIPPGGAMVCLGRGGAAWAAPARPACGDISHCWAWTPPTPSRLTGTWASSSTRPCETGRPAIYRLPRIR